MTTEVGQCECDQGGITKAGAFKDGKIGWIHMKQGCGKPLPEETKKRLELK